MGISSFHCVHYFIIIFNYFLIKEFIFDINRIVIIFDIIYFN